MVGTPVNLTLGRRRQEACHEFQVSLCSIAKSSSQRKYKGGGELKIIMQRGAQGCREQALLRREMRARDLGLVPQFRSKGETKSGARF